MRKNGLDLARGRVENINSKVMDYDVKCFYAFCFDKLRTIRGC